jgi:mono/diheme cytochrome c family protein
MGPVADNLASVPDADVKAIAVYVASVIGTPTPDHREQGERLAVAVRSTGAGTKPQSGGSQTVPSAAANDAGAIIFACACASCHESGRPAPYGGINLTISTTISATTPRNLFNIVLSGLPAAKGVRGPIMPGFAAVLTDQQLIQLASYLRAKFSDKQAWPDVSAQLRAAESGQPSAIHDLDALATANP